MLAATACGGGSTSGGPDAGAEPSAQLVILSPPGDAIGLLFGDRETIRVRYVSQDGTPIDGAAVEFGFVIGPTESTGGAALSDTTAITDGDGIASVDVVAGAERANFRVRATAKRAQAATFYVAVSDAGFTDLRVHPTHEGWRPDDDFARVELRLFRSSIVTCADIDIDDPPESVFPPRTLSGFGSSARFPNLSALEPYTLLAWGEVEPGGTRVSYGCIALGAAQIQPGPDVRVDAPVVDRALELPARAEISSTVDLAPLADAARAAGATRPWDVLACPAGPGQLLIDCALDAAVTVDGDPTDCALDDVAALDPLVTAIEALRDAPDSDGCRPLAGLDQTVTEAIAGGAVWPSGAALTQLLDARRAVSKTVRLGSVLEPVAPGAMRHTLAQARFDAGAGTSTIALLATARPVLSQPQVPADVEDGTVLVIAEHGFTLRLGSASRDAFTALGLEPLGLGDRAGDLGSALAESVDDGAQTGCPAFSAIVCDAAGEPTACLQAACAEAAGALDVSFGAWWRIAEGTGLDATLSGAGPLYDFDGDLQVDAVGADNGGVPEGTWTVRLNMADGTELHTTATFGAIGPG